MLNRTCKKKTKSTVTILLIFVLLAAMCIFQFYSSVTIVQAKTYDFGGTWKMTRKQSNGEKMKCILNMGWYTGAEDEYVGYFYLEVEGLYGVHHMDDYKGSVKKIGTNKWQGKDEYTDATFTFKVRKNKIIVKIKGGNIRTNWNDVPSGTFKLKKRLDYSKVS